MKKLDDTVRCAGQSFDSREICPDTKGCLRYIDLHGECLNNLTIVSTLWRDGKCNHKLKREETK